MTRPPPWLRVALAGLAYAAAVASAPWSWAAHPLAWAVATRAPYVAAAAVAVVAWATGARGSVATRDEHAARRIAALLTLSAVVDITAAGALYPGAPWTYAAPLSWATWLAVGGILLTCAITRRTA